MYSYILILIIFIFSILILFKYIKKIKPNQITNPNIVIKYNNKYLERNDRILFHHFIKRNRIVEISEWHIIHSKSNASNINEQTLPVSDLKCKVIILYT